MATFPADAPKSRVVRAFELLGFRMVREREHIAMARDNADGSSTPLTLPNHRRFKRPTLRRACTDAGVSREAFLDAYDRA